MPKTSFILTLLVASAALPSLTACKETPVAASQDSSASGAAKSETRKTVKFDPDLAKKDITGEGDVKATRKKTVKAAAEAKSEVPQ